MILNEIKEAQRISFVVKSRHESTGWDKIFAGFLSKRCLRHHIFQIVSNSQRGGRRANPEILWSSLSRHRIKLVLKSVVFNDVVLLAELKCAILLARARIFGFSNQAPRLTRDADFLITLFPLLRSDRQLGWGQHPLLRWELQLQQAARRRLYEPSREGK